MWRFLPVWLACCGLAACNQIFGIPTASEESNACGPARTTCAADATCSDAACVCNPGFTGDGATCSDVNECTAAVSPCATHATCTNTPGAFQCSCETTYTGDGLYCVPPSFTKIVTASSYSCALGSDGGIYCWGANALGQLGDPSHESHARPVQVGTDTDWIDLDTRTLTVCAIKRDHSLWCWGYGANGQLGHGTLASRDTPTLVVSDKPGVGWKAVSVGRTQTCGIHDDGSLACWGRDRQANRNDPLPVAVDLNTDWTHISTSTVRCGLRGTPGRLYCWGRSTTGDLGLGDAITSQATPMQVGADTWRTLASGFFNVCGIRSDGALFCWGNNGNNPTALHYGTAPRQIGTATDWQSVSLGSVSIIGLRTGGAAYGWGGNEQSQLALPQSGEIEEPTPLGGTITGWSHISTGNVSSCGLANGRVYCWGQVGDGYLGTGASTVFSRPTQIGADRWSALAIGATPCGLRSDGGLACWGYSLTNGVGHGNTEPVWAPTRIGVDTWSTVSAGTFFNASSACAIRAGKPWCWGDNSYGQLAIGTPTSPQLSPAPVAVPSGTQWREMAIANHTCGITNDGALWCWGLNDTGQLGSGTTTSTTAPSAPLAGTWLHVAVASYNLPAGSMTCAIRSDRTLWCWGNDLYPATTQHLVPTQVGNDATWSALSMAPTSNALNGGVTTCAIKLDGTLWCWGMWLGNGTQDASSVPVQVGTATDWKSITVNGEICGIRGEGTLWCWANNGYLGDGNRQMIDPATLDSLWNATPTRLGTDSDWASVATYAGIGPMSCAIKTDGTLWCWGSAAAPVPGLLAAPQSIH